MHTHHVPLSMLSDWIRQTDIRTNATLSPRLRVYCTGHELQDILLVMGELLHLLTDHLMVSDFNL